MSSLLGLNFGCGNAYAAVWKNKQPVLIPFRKNVYAFPMVAALDNKNHLLLGSEAKRQIRANPKKTFYELKRLMGKYFSPDHLRFLQSYFSFSLKENGQGKVTLVLPEKEIEVEDYFSLLLEQIRDQAQEFLEEEIFDVVIAVPVYFHEQQYQSIRQAAKKAGFSQVHFILEPVAGVLAYEIDKNKEQQLLILDYGQGGLDISLIQIRDGRVFISASDGDTFLGGKILDDKIFAIAKEKLSQRERDGLSALEEQRLLDACENAKIELSTQNEVSLHLPYLSQGSQGPLHFEMNLTQSQLETVIEPCLEEMLKRVRNVLQKAKLSPKNIDQILLMGGGSNIPQISRRLENTFGYTPLMRDPLEGQAAIGALVFSQSLKKRGSPEEGKGSRKSLPCSIGVEDAQGNFIRVFRRDSKIPTTCDILVSPFQSNQRRVYLPVYQGESRLAKDNIYLGNIEFLNLPGKMKKDVFLKVSFHLESNGDLILKGKNLSTAEESKTVLSLKHCK